MQDNHNKIQIDEIGQREGEKNKIKCDNNNLFPCNNQTFVLRASLVRVSNNCFTSHRQTAVRQSQHHNNMTYYQITK